MLSVAVIVVGNGIGDVHSNPGWKSLLHTNADRVHYLWEGNQSRRQKTLNSKQLYSV